jgi:hypothetical protein
MTLGQSNKNRFTCAFGLKMPQYYFHFFNNTRYKMHMFIEFSNNHHSESCTYTHTHTHTHALTHTHSHTYKHIIHISIVKKKEKNFSYSVCYELTAFTCFEHYLLIFKRQLPGLERNHNSRSRQQT